jgi:prepilin-type N-terminal cleavage/methylation domain-containing protein
MSRSDPSFPVSTVYSRGFTLIEIVVALAIATMAIATTSMAVKLASDYLMRVDPLLARQRALLSLKEEIDSQTLFTIRSGKGQWREVKYRWEAELLEAGPQQPRSGSEEEGMKTTTQFEVGLFQCTLTLEYDSGRDYRYGWRTLAYRPWEGGNG